ncbi:MAG: TonB family protein [Vicinamibacterales bacterium]
MPASRTSSSSEQPSASEHISVRPVGDGPAEVHFLFEQQQKRMGGALGASIMAHVAFLLAVLLFLRVAPESVTNAILPDDLPKEIVWLVQPGPGGGGGGGNKSPEPPKKAEAPGKDPITVPAVKEPEPTPTPEIKEEPKVVETPQLEIPARTMAADSNVAPSAGVLDSGATTSSTGSGTGTGAGSGTGSGLGPGSGGGTGGGVFQVGNGVLPPQAIMLARPNYTSDAMRAKIQGVVALQCVVEPDGTASRCTVQRSLDRAFGLDQEAIKAVERSRFRPGTRFGEPVAVQVGIEMSFTLR